MRFMLYEFLKDNYKEAEPIFFSEPMKLFL